MGESVPSLVPYMVAELMSEDYKTLQLGLSSGQKRFEPCRVYNMREIVVKLTLKIFTLDTILTLGLPVSLLACALLG